MLDTPRTTTHAKCVTYSHTGQHQASLHTRNHKQHAVGYIMQSERCIGACMRLPVVKSRARALAIYDCDARCVTDAAKLSVHSLD